MAPASIRRGTLTVAPRVVEKIAAVAAAGVPPVGAPPPRVVRWTARWRRAGRGSQRRHDHRFSPQVTRPPFVTSPEADGDGGALGDLAGSGATRSTSPNREVREAHVAGSLSGVVADSGGLPAVSARLGGGSVRLTVSMSVAYPASLLDAAGEVRERIRDRVTALTGLQVTSIEINISALVAPEGNLVDSSGSGRDGHA